MQAHVQEVFFSKNCIFTLSVLKLKLRKNFLYCCLLIIASINYNVQFSRCIFEFLSQETQWSFNLSWNFSQSLNLAFCILHFAFCILHLEEVVGQNGLEPSTSRLSVVCSSQLSYWPMWWRLRESNPWPPACKAGALPAELNPQLFKLPQNWTIPNFFRPSWLVHVLP